MSSSTSSSGISLYTVLFLIFLVLKLAEIGSVAHWSWWWVTSPLWIPWLLIIAIGLIYLFVKLIQEIFQWLKNWNYRRQFKDFDN